MVIEKDFEVIEIEDETVKNMFSMGVKNWYQLGLRFSSKNTWKGEFWILDIVDKQKFFMAKIKYGF